jgi:hypothetical protein
MSAPQSKLSLRERQIVDDAVLAYVGWREECAAVWNAYDWWASAPAEDARRAHAAYRAALDREEAAANVYARPMGRVGDLVETGLDYPLECEDPSGSRT